MTLQVPQPLLSLTLLMGLMLLTAACQKEDAQPEPASVGTWRAASLQATNYSRDGVVLAKGDVIPTPNVQTWTFRSSTLETNLAGSFAYVRQGDTLTLTPTGKSSPYSEDYLIKELTKTNLTLEYKIIQSRFNDYSLTLLRFVRQ